MATHQTRKRLKLVANSNNNPFKVLGQIIPMDTREETKKRLLIAKGISSQLEGIVRGVLLGGSMSFGQNFSVTDKSDIDMVVVCDKARARDLEKTPYFKGEVHDGVLNMFREGVINLFWVTKEVDSVEVNSFVY